MKEVKEFKLRPGKTLFFELSDPRYKEMFFTLKKEISEEQLSRNNKRTISNIQCFKLILEKQYNIHLFNQSKIIQRLKELRKDLIRKKIELNSKY